MNKRVAVVLAMMVFLNFTSVWAATDRYLISSDFGSHVSITEVGLEKGRTSYESRNVWLPFNADGGIYDPHTKVMRGISPDGEVLEFQLGELIGIEVLADIAGKTTKAALKLDALRQENKWQPRGMINQAVFFSGMVIDFSGLAPDLFPDRKVMSWQQSDGNLIEIPFHDLLFLQFKRSDTGRDMTSNSKEGMVVRVRMLSGQMFELSHLSPTLDIGSKTVRWTDSGGKPRELSFSDIARIEIEPDNEDVVRGYPASWPRVAADLEPQDRLRLEMGRLGNNEGNFISSSDAILTLDGEKGETSILVADIDKLWVRGRGTWTGAKIGAIIGVAGGALLGAAAAAIGQDYGGETDPWVGAAGGALAGGAILGLLGAGIGAATPKWHLKYEAIPGAMQFQSSRPIAPQEEKEMAPTKAVRGPRIGGLRIMGGYSVSTRSGEPGGGLGAMLDYLAQIKPTLSLGPEIGYSGLGGSASFFHLGATAVLNPTKWNDKFYLIGGIDLYDWSGELDSAGGVGFVLGGGRRFRSQSSLSSLELEVRWHSNISRAGIDGVTSLVSIMAGYHRSW